MATDYLSASFGGVSMHILQIDTDHGHDVAVQSPSSGDTHATFDRGRRVNIARCEVIFVDRPGLAPHLERYQSFIGLANGKPQETHVLVHPLDGAYTARAEAANASAAAGEVGIRVQCTFIREYSDEENSPILEAATSVASFEAVAAIAGLANEQLLALGIPAPPEIAASVATVQEWVDEAEESLDPQKVFLGVAARVRELDAAINRLELLTHLDRWIVYQTMIELRYEVARTASALTERAKSTFELITNAPRPLISICAEVYGAEDAETRADEVARRNRVRTPARVAAGTVLVMERP